MVLSATVIGALLGLGTQMYSNALRKLPYMRHPWEHVVGMGLGVVFVNQLVKWDAQLEQDLDKMLLKAKEANERRYFGTLSFSYLDHIFLLQQFFFSGFALFFLISSSFSLGPRFLLLKFGFFF
ncbi:hypothetical protein BDE02_03G141000 [Populus trichocarpa]|nr:hypothetical protein BDE02_03G141000 [Populus trichocarpa]